MVARGLEGIKIVSGFCFVSGRCQEYVKRVDAGYSEGVWNKNPHLISIGRKGPMCQTGQFSTGQNETG